MKYIIYKTSTGEVLRTLNTNLETIQLNCNSDEDYIAYLSDNLDVHIEVIDGVKTIMPGRIDSRSPEEKARVEWFVVRRERDKRLADTDWISLRYIDQLGSVPDKWVEYRQALRDVTKQADPFAIIWPNMPII